MCAYGKKVILIYLRVEQVRVLSKGCSYRHFFHILIEIMSFQLYDEVYFEENVCCFRLRRFEN